MPSSPLMLICAAGVGLAALLYYYFTVREREGQQYAHEYADVPDYGGHSLEEAKMGHGYYRLDQCSICQDGICKRRSAVRLACGHAFHRSCMEKWMEAALYTTCPNCRKPIASLS